MFHVVEHAGAGAGDSTKKHQFYQNGLKIF